MRALCLAAFAALSLTSAASALDTVNVANVSRTLFSLPLWITEPGVRKVFETLQLSGDLDAEEKFDLSRFTDLQYLESSRTQ